MAPQHFSRKALGDAIEEVSSEYVGAVMSKAARTAHFKRLGIDQERLGTADVDAVMKSLRLSLKVLVGDQTAEKAVAKIRNRVGA